MGVIRLTLALCVVVWHMQGPHVRLLNAAVAVLLFFVVSGFYMALVVNEKYAPSGPGWRRRFYTARFLRLYPAYFAMCAFMVAWYWWTGNPSAFTSRLPVPVGEQAMLAAINVGVIGQDLFEMMNHIGGEPVRSIFSPMFFNGRWMLVGQAWSLSSEIFFYLLVPLVVRSPWRVVALLFLSLSLRALLIGGLGYESGVWGYWFPPATMCMFALGSLSYSIYRHMRASAWSAPIGWCALIGMVAWLIWRVAVDKIVLPVGLDDFLDAPHFWAAYLTFAAAVPFVFIATKRLAIDRMIGDLSYPLYLAHGVVLGILFSRWGLRPDSLWSMTVGIAASLLAAIGLRTVEVVIERIRMPTRSEVRPNRIAQIRLWWAALDTASVVAWQAGRRGDRGRAAFHDPSH